MFRDLIRDIWNLRKHPQVPLIAFVILALGGGYALKIHVDHNIREIQQANVQSCERNEIVRRELVGFLEDAANARTKSGDIKIAKDYLRRANRIRFTIYVNCIKKYSK